MTTITQQPPRVGILPLTSMTHPIGIARVGENEFLAGYRPGDFSRAEAAEIVRLLVGEYIDIDQPARPWTATE